MRTLIRPGLIPWGLVSLQGPLASSTSAPGPTRHPPTESRAIHPDPLQGMGFCDAFPDLRRPQRLSVSIPVDLYSH